MLATHELLRALAVAQETESAYAVQLSNALISGHAVDVWLEMGTQADATRKARDAALLEVEQARQALAELLARA